MEKKEYIYLIMCVAIMAALGCRQTYTPPAAANAVTNFLVVDGFINAGSDSTIFTLSRTRSLAAAPYPVPEAGAQVVVQGNGGYSIQLANLGNGRYGAANLNLDISQQYRVSIITGNGSKYLSDYTPVKQSPPIDSISWQRSDTGVSIYANTHDPLNNTRYYRWDYTETWEYQSTYVSYLYYQPADSTLISSPTEVPHTCWDTANSTNIYIASSANLSKDVISQAPLTVVPLNSERISVKYSILVRQYALTLDAYNYWVNLQKSTELGGTLFDQEPSQITGNIHSVTNPNEPVIGYVSAGSLAEARIFISNGQVLPWVYQQPCGTVTLHSKDSLAYYENTGGWLAVETLPPGTFDIAAYIMSSNFCVDCTAKGGTNVQPPYWQ